MRRRPAVGAGAAHGDEPPDGRGRPAPRRDAGGRQRRLDQRAAQLHLPVAAALPLRLGGPRHRDGPDLQGHHGRPRPAPARDRRRHQRGRRVKRRLRADGPDRRLRRHPRRVADEQGQEGQEVLGQGEDFQQAQEEVRQEADQEVEEPPVEHNGGMAESLRGKLILASPVLRDPNFSRTVVLIAEHTDDGAMGLVLNRPAGSTVGEAVPDLSWLAGETEPVFVGGPVAETAVIVLAEFERPELAGALVEGDLGFIGSGADDPERLGGATRRARVFAGHAGWGPGQLEDELAEEAWIIEPPERPEIFTEDPDGLWSQVLRRKGREFALLSTMPLDPTLN